MEIVYGDGMFKEKNLFMEKTLKKKYRDKGEFKIGFHCFLCQKYSSITYKGEDLNKIACLHCGSF
jgi:hypothetical protein